MTYVLACVFKQAQGCSPGVFKGRGDCPLFTRRRSLGTAVGRSHELIASSVCAVCSQFVFTRPVTSVRCTRAVSVCAVCHQFGFVRPVTSVRCTRAAAMTGSDRVRCSLVYRIEPRSKLFMLTEMSRFDQLLLLRPSQCRECRRFILSSFY